MSSSMWKSLVAIPVLALVCAAGAAAEVCGDADGSGTVTVTDGVQTLRAAASLSSTCNPARCDVDGSGTITVSDGVNVLRKAAHLPITEACPGTSLDAQVQGLLQGSLPLFGALVKGFGGGAAARAAETLECENPGGTFTVEDSGRISFHHCVMGGGLEYDGFSMPTANGLDFDLTFTEVATGEYTSMSGSFTETAHENGSVLNGHFDFSSSASGRFRIIFDALVVSDDPNATFISGSLEFQVEDPAWSGVTSIRLSFDGSEWAMVDVLLGDDQFVAFRYNLVTGELESFSH